MCTLYTDTHTETALACSCSWVHEMAQMGKTKRFAHPIPYRTKMEICWWGFFSVWLFLAGENKRLLDLLWHNIAIDKAILIYFILFIDSKRQREREQGTWSSLQRSQVDSVETGKLFYGTYHVIEKFTSFALCFLAPSLSHYSKLFVIWWKQWQNGYILS